jgi:hypothetical protein
VASRLLDPSGEKIYPVGPDVNGYSAQLLRATGLYYIALLKR